MKKMMAMLLASVMVAGTFATTAFAYTGDDVQKNTSVSTAAQEADAAGSANAGKTDNTDSIEIDPDMQVLPDGYEVSTDADGNLIVTVGGKEYNIGSEKSRKQMGTVVPGITSLHFRSGPGMDQEIIGYLHSGDTVEIVEKYGDWYKVNFNGKTGYAHGKYLNVTDSANDSSMFSEDALKLFLDLMQGGMSSEDETESSTALTPEGNMTLVDDIGEEEDKSSQQFITLVTKAGNTFYLIIDRDKDGNQNVHFLNMVDEADLLALMDEEEAANSWMRHSPSRQVSGEGAGSHGTCGNRKAAGDGACTGRAENRERGKESFPASDDYAASVCDWCSRCRRLSLYQDEGRKACIQEKSTGP